MRVIEAPDHVQLPANVLLHRGYCMVLAWNSAGRKMFTFTIAADVVLRI